MRTFASRTHYSTEAFTIGSKKPLRPARHFPILDHPGGGLAHNVKRVAYVISAPHRGLVNGQQRKEQSPGHNIGTLACWNNSTRRRKASARPTNTKHAPHRVNRSAASQKPSFNPNWMIRGSLALVIRPRAELPSSLPGGFQFAWFTALKNSARNCTFTFSA